MDKRFLTIWATVSIGGAFTAQSTNRPLAMSITWAVMGLIVASLDCLSRKETTK